ncbi:hypothetical protein CU098_013135 [Rhizopus stolonifer]|uniref:tRNA-binding domain-containing protein n=2 Tax=Mucorineae TaxID=1344963 RepID=A0A367KU83_RHIST|nr:hypothetical protein CU098_013135 [Rhizopus stolonifer]
MLTLLRRQNVSKNNAIRAITRFNHTGSAVTDQDLIHRVDLRVGKIVHIEAHSEAQHLFIEQVDLNTESTEAMPNPRTIVSGLAPYMSMDSILNRKVIVVSNLKPSKFRGVLSQGMLLAASSNDNKTVKLLSPPEESVIGERVALEGVNWQGLVDPVLKPKQKVFEQVAASFKTNIDGIATYKGIILKTSAGPITCDIKDAQIS